MFFKMDGDDENGFSYRAAKLIVRSEKAKLRDLFCRTTAAAIVEEGPGVKYDMADELREAFLKPHQRIARNIFGDI